MKEFAKRGLSMLLALIMCFSLITVATPMEAEAASYTYNWGTREDVADEADFTYSTAEEWYDKHNASYEELSQLDGSATLTSVPNSELYLALQGLMVDAHGTKTSYDGTKSMYQYTDCENGGGKISSFYSGTAIGPGWGEGGSWNREHTWPKSKSLNGNSNGGQDETDIMMLRPTTTSENSSRGNTAYGEKYYDPNEASGGKLNLHGDCARICLYVYVRWGNSQYMWGSSGVMESLNVLLKWMEEDPVDTWELGRNDSVEAITGTRNVFVDYPELAFALFNVQVPAGYQTPSGGVSQGAFKITAVSDNESMGTVSVRGNTITALSAPGNRIAGYEILSGSAKVTQNNSAFTVEAQSDVTVKIFFEAIPIFTVDFRVDGNRVNSQQVYDGESIDLPSLSDKDGYAFVGWTKSNVTDTANAPEYFRSKTEFAVKQSITLYALFSRNDGGTVSYFTVFPSDCEHPNAYETDKKEPTCTEAGREAGKYCPDCEKYVSGGQEINASGHLYPTPCDTVCSVCGEDNGQTPAHEFDVRNICIHCGYSADNDTDASADNEESAETSIYYGENSKNDNISHSNNESQTDDSDENNTIVLVVFIAAAGVLAVGVTVVLIVARKKK